MGQSRSVLGVSAAVTCLLVTVLAGCRSPQQTPGEPPLPAAGIVHESQAEPPLPAAGIVYESQGEILALAAATIEGREQAFIWERVGADVWPLKSKAVLRALRLDLATRQATLLGERPSPVPESLDGIVAVSADGRCAGVAAHWDATPGWSGVLVSDDGEMWTDVTPSEDRLRTGPRWSPDGSALAYYTMTYEDERSGKIASWEAVALAVPRPPRVGSEIVLARPGHFPVDLGWAPSGRRIYLISHPLGERKSLLEAVDWPTLSRRQLMRARGLDELSVARASGDVIVMEVREKQSGETADAAPVVVWRLQPDGTVGETAVRLDRLPIRAIVSPDGERLAVVTPAEDSDPTRPIAGGLVVYQLADGSSQRIDVSPITFSPSTFFGPPPVHWVLGGQALLFQEGEDKVRLLMVEP